jgi:hypothetical protein
MRQNLRCVVMGLFILAVSFLGLASADEVAKSPLAALPSKPGPHIEKVKALQDGEWLNLGQPVPDPRWGLACGRVWTPKMAVAPDLGGAFLYGEGVHGYVKPDGHYMDDLWFYDVRAHAWICCYPGTNMKELDTEWEVNQDGFIARKDGQVPPMASLVHGYNVPCYSPDLKKFMGMGGTSYATKEINALRARLLPERPAAMVNMDRSHPYFYDVTTGRWERKKVPSGPQGIEVYGTTVAWLPTVKRFCLIYNNDTWLYDYEKNVWTNAQPAGRSPGGGEGLHCYDTRRHRLYRFTGGGDGKPGRFGIYDPDANEWIESTDDFQPPVVSGGNYYTNSGYAHYDAANDVVVVWLNGKIKPGAYVYEPAKDRWIREPVAVGPKKGRSAFYSEEFNAHFFFDAGDSSTKPGNIWVWRYKTARKQSL